MATSSTSSLPRPIDGDHNRGAAVIVVGTVFGSLGLVLVSTRLWVRQHIVKNLGLDDLFIVLGLVSSKCLPHPHPLSRRFLTHQNQIFNHNIPHHANPRNP